MMDLLSEFADALAANGFAPESGGVIADDCWHRLRYNGEKVSSGRYRLKIVNDGFAIGNFGSEKSGKDFVNWHSKSKEIKLTNEERRAYQERVNVEKREKELKRAHYEKRLSLRLNKLFHKFKDAEPTNDYLKKKRVQSHGISERNAGRELIIPMYGSDDLIWNFQRIAAFNGWKGFFKGARVNGCFFPFGEYKSGPLIICEGWATGASIYEATDLPVFAAFTAGNLRKVADVIKKIHPKAEIIFAADNDAFTFDAKKKPEGLGEISGDDPRWEEWRAAGMLYNTGRDRASQAAASIGGAKVIWPEFFNVTARPTDFNDLACQEGYEAVKARIDKAIAEKLPEPEYPDYDMPAEEPLRMEWPFRVLGYYEGMFYFFPRNSKQIVALTANALGSPTSLFQLAPMEFWQEYFGGEKVSSRKMAEIAANALMQQAFSEGTFRPENIRGVGVWRDEEFTVIHAGRKLIVNGNELETFSFRSDFIYPYRNKKLSLTDNILSASEASQLREICKEISWESKLSGELLAGWIVVAPICGALDWRPHIWIEGESESGKTTVIERIIMPLIGKIALRFDGGTTEAAVRQRLGIDALPVIYDEAEPENMKDKIIMEGLLLLARRASSGATISKGGANGRSESYTLRSCFCFAGINPAIKQRADESRISRLVIKKSRRPDADEFFKKLSARMIETLTPEFGERLLARTLSLLPTIAKNAHTFTAAAAETLSSRRAADQVGAMLAGLYSLTSSKEITTEAAVTFIQSHEWTLHTAIEEDSDPQRLITYISTYSVKYNNRDRQLGEMIEFAYNGLYNLNLDNDDPGVGRFLRGLGIWVKKDGVSIINKSPPLDKILSATPWVNWARPLKDIGLAVAESPARFAPGLYGRSVRVPIFAFNIKEIITGYNDEERRAIETD